MWMRTTTHNITKFSQTIVLAVMGAVAVVIEKRSPARLVGAGALCGLASCFTTTRGIVAASGFAVFLVWEYRQRRLSWPSLLKAEVLLLAPFLASIVAVNAYFSWKVGLERFLDCTVSFVFRFYPADRKWNSLQVYMTEVPRFLPWYRLPALGVWLFVHGLLPLVYLLFFSRYRGQARDTSQVPWDRLMLLAIVGLFLFMGIAPAPGWVRLCSVSLPALILLVWLANSPGKLHQVVSGLLWVVAVVLVVGELVERQNHWKAYLDVPGGRTALFSPLAYDKYEWLSRRTRPAEFFLEGAFADMYFPLGLRNPAGVPFLTNNDYTRPEQVRNVIEGLEKHRVRLVLWSLGLDLPTEGRPSGDHLAPLRAYLHAHYRVVKTFGDFDQVWERNE